MSDLRQEIKEIGDKARALKKLEGHEGWEVLKTDFTVQQDAYERRIARQVTRLGRDAEPLNQRHIDYERGFWRGVQAVLGSPEAAQKALENALKRTEDHA